LLDVEGVVTGFPKQMVSKEKWSKSTESAVLVAAPVLAAPVVFLTFPAVGLVEVVVAVVAPVASAPVPNALGVVGVKAAPLAVVAMPSPSIGSSDPPDNFLFCAARPSRLFWLGCLGKEARSGEGLRGRLPML
jgi:hypothetical protein